MKHVLFGSKSLFVGDEAADLLVDYAAHVAQLRTGDRVDMRGFSRDGYEVTISFLLNSGTDLVVETTDLPFEDPDNAGAVGYLRERIEAMTLSEQFVAGFQFPSEATA